MKNLITICLIALAFNSFAQLPSYVPTNGLVAWYPFNGNANDESGNGNNGTASGATLTIDRNGTANAAYSFDGLTNFIDLGINPQINSILGDFSFSYWVNTIGKYQTVIASYSNQALQWRFISRITWDSAMTDFNAVPNLSWQHSTTYANAIQYNVWKHLIIVRNGTSMFYYVDGQLYSTSQVNSSPINNPSNTITKIGYNFAGGAGGEYFEGKIDDIAFYNRALTPQEINDLYTASPNCNLINNITLTTSINNGQNVWSTGDTSTSITVNPSTLPYVWLNNGSCTDTIFFNSQSASIYDTTYVTISDTNFVTITDTNLVTITDTNLVTIVDTNFVTVTDTNFVTITDTNYISVTDTLIINALLTGLNPPNNTNTLLVFPNPSSDHITIDYGNFNLMSGYTLKIENAIGQTVFTTPITQQQSYIDLSSWSGNGIYFVHVIDGSNNTIDIRKIVLQ